MCINGSLTYTPISFVNKGLLLIPENMKGKYRGSPYNPCSIHAIPPMLSMSP